MKQQKEALFHDGSSQFCKYNEKSDTYTFILRTTIGVVNQAFMAIFLRSFPIISRKSLLVVLLPIFFKIVSLAC